MKAEDMAGHLTRIRLWEVHTT